MVYIFIFDVFRVEIIVCKQCRPDQTPRSVVSDLGLHCLFMS